MFLSEKIAFCVLSQQGVEGRKGPGQSEGSIAGRFDTGKQARLEVNPFFLFRCALEFGGQGRFTGVYNNPHDIFFAWGAGD